MTSLLYKGPQIWIEPLTDGYVLQQNEIAARALVVHEDKVLLVYEADTDTWFTPGGRLDKGEQLDVACRREVEEETALDVTIGDIVAVFDVVMPRVGYLAHKFEFIFAAALRSAPDFIERAHIDKDQSGPVVSKMRWFTAEETKALSHIFPEFLREWPSLLRSGESHG